jgi:type II secretory pathway pseudopilin PulG
MARINQRNVINAVSIANTAIGEYLADGTKFRKFKQDATGPVFPTRTTVPDTEVGDGSAYDKHSTPYYYDPISKSFSGSLDNKMGIRILRQWMGGAATVTTNTTPGTKDYAVVQLAPGSAPMVCNEIRANGGNSILFGDVFRQTVEISQQGSGQPRLSATSGNGGYSKPLSSTAIVTSDITDPDPRLKFDGKKTTFTFSDGVSSYDFVSEKRLIDLMFSGNQNVLTEQLPGDLPLDAAAECQGGFTQNIYIDVQSAMMKAKVYMKETFAEYLSWVQNRKLTSVTAKWSTCEIIGATTHHAEIEVKFPVAEFILTPDTQGNFDAYSMEIKAIEGDPVSKSLVLMRFRIVGLLDETA